MNTHFKRMMAQAAHLMRSGRLGEATAAIQSALGAGAAPVGPASAPPGRPHGDDIVDVTARVIDDARGPSDAPAAAAPVGESFTAGRFRNELGALDYKLFEPPRDGTPLPLVVMLHGCTQDPDDFARGTAMNELARRRGLLVLYPAQARRANAQGCWNWFKHHHQAAGRGEPGVLAGLVRDVAARHGVDPARVYVAGLSAGGAMAAILGDAYPELFAAVGVHSGLPTGSARDVQSAFAAMKGGAPPAPRGSRRVAPPTIVFHGDADATVAPVNGDRVVEASGLAAGATLHEDSGTTGRGYRRRQWRDEQGAVRAEQWTIRGAGHAWSGGSAQGSYADPQGPDASAEMLRFFLAHRLAGR